MVARLRPEESPMKSLSSINVAVVSVRKLKIKANSALMMEMRLWQSPRKIGEVVAIAQRYNDIPFTNEMAGLSIGWLNKMFVKSSLMPHQIKITNIRCERLQYISTDDCMREGIFCSHIDGIVDAYSYDATNDDFAKKWWYRTPIEAYKMLSSKLHLLRQIKRIS